MEMQIARIGGGSNELYSAEGVGSKATNLARMAALGLPVPPAFVLPVDLCAVIVNNEGSAKQMLTEGLGQGIEFLQNATGKHFGGRRRPLLVSVRSGAAQSMPGMLDTVLDVGCTSAAVQGLVRMSGNPRFSWDCRRRFLESYGAVVLGVDRRSFQRRLGELVAAEGVEGEPALDGEALERLAANYRDLIEEEDCVLPDDPMEQLAAAAQAVFRSWNSERARAYRELQRLEHLRGTAVTIQAMVFGNRGLSSGAGVAFSRDPSTGEPTPVIDILFESQGEDVVSGNRNPAPEDALARSMPAAAVQLRETLSRVEQEMGDVQDVEFTIEDGRLWILQTRSAKRTPQAALRFAIDFVKEGRITPSEALRRLSGVDLITLASKRLIAVSKPAGRGTGASAGVAVGRAAFDSATAERLASSGPVILVRPDTSTADVVGFSASEGIVTAVGARTAHAALLARQMGKPCIVGCAGLTIDVSGRCARLAGIAIKEGDWLSIDSGAGTVYLGRLDIVVDRPEGELAEIARWRSQIA
jgi:pyruvate,orthophosphate dikinase